MDEVLYSDFIELVLSGMPVDTGFMLLNGVEFFDTATEFLAVYNTNAVPYIEWQEEGFKHYITKKKVNVNKGFITVKTWGKITSYANSKTLGLPFDMSESNEVLLANQEKMMVELGAIQYV